MHDPWNLQASTLWLALFHYCFTKNEVPIHIGDVSEESIQGFLSLYNLFLDKNPLSSNLHKIPCKYFL